MQNFKGLIPKEVKRIAQAYLLDCIPDNATILSEYGEVTTTDTDRVNWVMADFIRVANYPHNMRNIPNNQARIADWLMGLPGVIRINYTDYDIIELAKKWGALPDNPTDKACEKIVSNWFNYIAFKFMQLHTKLNKPVKA